MNEKGGTAKTTVAVHAAAFFATSGLRTALLDMDPQGSAGRCLGIPLSPQEPSIFEAIIEEKTTLPEVLKESRLENLWVAPSDTRLADLTLNIAWDDNRQSRLASILDSLDEYDAILIDSPGSLGMGTINVIMAAHEVIIPVPLTFLGTNGCIQTMKTILRMWKIRGRKKPDVRAILPVMFDNSMRQKRFLSFLQKRFTGHISKAIIPFDEKIDQAQFTGRTMYETCPGNPTTISFEKFSNDLLNCLSQ